MSAAEARDGATKRKHATRHMAKLADHARQHNRVESFVPLTGARANHLRLGCLDQPAMQGGTCCRRRMQARHDRRSGNRGSVAAAGLATEGVDAEHASCGTLPTQRGRHDHVDGEEGFEKQFAVDEELKFKATARRNKMLGLWAAGEARLSGAEADAYAKEVVVADFEEAGDHDVFGKIRRDFDAKGVHESDHQIRRTMDELMAKAVQDIKAGR